MGQASSLSFPPPASRLFGWQFPRFVSCSPEGAFLYQPRVELKRGTSETQPWVASTVEDGIPGMALISSRKDALRRISFRVFRVFRGSCLPALPSGADGGEGLSAENGSRRASPSGFSCLCYG